jgi:hypothetical protein
LVTAGDHVRYISRFLKPVGKSYPASEVIRQLLSEKVEV